MEEKANPAAFFESMFEIYEVLPERRDVVINQIVIYGQFSKFLEFLSSKVSSPNLSVSSAKAVVDLVTDYMVLYKDGFDPTSINMYVAFLLRLVALRTAPSSYETFSEFLKISFQTVKSYNHETLFKDLTSLPTENCLMPLAAFAVVNSQYLARAFRFVLGQIDAMFKSQKGIVWVLAFSLLLSAEEKVELDKTHVLAAFNTTVGNASIPLGKKIKMLDRACQYLMPELALAVANCHFKSLINGVTPKSSADDVADAIMLATTVFRLVPTKSASALDAKKVVDSVFVTLSVFYKPVRRINEALTDFCAQIDKEEMERLVTSSIKAGMSKGCVLFLVSRYPTHETLPILLSKQEPEEEKGQYIAVFYYLSHNSVHFRYLPRLFELLEPSDIKFLDELFQKRPDLYCMAVIKYLAHAKTVLKVDAVAKFLSEAETLPLICSPYCQAAFAVASVLRAYSSQEQSLRVLIEYLHECAVYSRQQKVKQSNCKAESGEILSLTNNEVALLKKRGEEDTFDVVKGKEHGSACGFCQAQLIRDWCMTDKMASQWYTEYALGRIQQGDVDYTLLLAHLSPNKALLRNCIASVRNAPHLLRCFFSYCACCSPADALTELKSYIVTDHHEQSGSFLGRLFTTPVKTDTILQRQKLAQGVLAVIAPFVPFSQELLDVLLATIPEEMTNEKWSCAAVTAVCGRLTHRELLQSLLDKLLGQFSKYDVKSFASALTAMVKANETKTDQLMARICHVWVQLLLTNEVPVDTEFEEALFDPYYHNTPTLYIKQMEKTLIQHSDCVALFESLRRAMNMKAFNISQFNVFVTVFISNCLSASKPISEFCVSVLQQLYGVTVGVDTAHGSRFSFEYLSGVRPFLTQLASKFNIGNSITLFEALLDHVRSNSDSSCSIVLFSLFLVGKDPKAFIKSKTKFVPKIVTVCSKMKRKTDYPVMFYFFRILDLLATSDTTAFYNQFLLTDENEFSNLYLHRFVHSPTFSDAIAVALLKQLQDLTSFYGKRSSDFVVFPRMIMLLKYHVKYFVTESTPDERMASILFGILLLLSSINNMRSRSIPYADMQHALLKVFRVFSDNTGIDLANGQTVDLSSDEQYCQTLANFVSFMHLMSYSLANVFVDKLQALQKTHHSATACIVAASLLRLYSSAASEAGKKLSDKLLAFYLGLLKQESYPENIIIDSITRASTALTFEALLGFTADNLQKLLAITLEATARATKAGINRCIDMLLNILRAANTQFLTSHAKSILKCLNRVVKSKTMELGTVPMLNVIGELTKKVQDAAWFLKPDAISFYSLIPLAVDPSPKVSQRALGIFAVVIFNKASGFDAQLLFSSLMSIFCGIEHDTANYVAMAVHLVECLDKSPTLAYSDLELLGHVMDPVLAVSDANCNLGLQSLLNFLRKQSRSPREEIATKAMSLMAHFATPKQRLQRRA